LTKAPHGPEYRVALRALTESDIDDRYAAWFASGDSHLDYYSASGRIFTRESLIAELRQAQREGDLFLYAIVLMATNQVIGNVKIGPIQPRHQTSDLVVLIGDRRYLGQGLAREAIAQGNRLAFEDHGVRKLSGSMIEANTASIKAYLAAGWVVEGRLKAQYVIDGRPMDQILVACFNPRLFPDQGRAGG